MRRVQDHADQQLGDAIVDHLLDQKALRGHFPRCGGNGIGADQIKRNGRVIRGYMGLLPDDAGAKGVNSIWMLDPFRTDNGTARIVPGTHRSGRNPVDALDDPLAAHEDEVWVTGDAGDVLVFNVHAWHAGTANESSAERLALNSFYCRRDQPQQVWQRGWIDEEVQATFSPELRALLALDDAENDRLSENPAERSGFMKAT